MPTPQKCENVAVLRDLNTKAKLKELADLMSTDHGRVSMARAADHAISEALDSIKRKAAAKARRSKS